jgi:hypothetical protein
VLPRWPATPQTRSRPTASCSGDTPAAVPGAGPKNRCGCPIAGPREFLTRYGIVASQWDGLLDGQPLSAAEEELVIRLLNLYSRFSQENVEDWADRDLTPQRLASAPSEQRGKIVRLTGSVRRASRVSLLAEAATRNEFAAYYQVQMQLESQHVVMFHCRDLPAAWKLDVEMNENAVAYGLFLKVGDAEAGSPLLLVTDRIAWLPREPRPGCMSGPLFTAALEVAIGRLQVVGKERALASPPSIASRFIRSFRVNIRKRSGPGGRSAHLDRRHSSRRQRTPVRCFRPRHRLPRPPGGRPRCGHPPPFIDHGYEVDLSLPLSQKIAQRRSEFKDRAVMYETGFPATICVSCRRQPSATTCVNRSRPTRSSSSSGSIRRATPKAGLDQPAPSVSRAADAAPEQVLTSGRMLVGVAMAPAR